MDIFRRLIYLALLGLMTGPLLAEEAQGPNSPPAPPAASSQPLPSAISPLSSEEKFRLAVRKSFISPLSYVTSAGAAGLSMATRSSSDYGMGAKGFARRWGDSMGSRAVHEITGTWIAASLLHQDPRYYPSPQREFGPRLKYAATRPLITRGDDGSTQFNTSNLIGTMASATAATAWHPHETDHTKKWFTRVGTGLALDSAWKVAREFIHVK